MIQVHASEDINELAARLGAANSVDRRGNVIAFDSFERGIGSWGFSFNDMGSNANWTALQGLYGALTAQLHTVAGATKYSTAGRQMLFPQSGSLGAEWGFSHSITPTLIEARVLVYTGTTYQMFTVRYTYSSGVMAYLNDAGWQTLYTDTKVFLVSQEVSNFIKLVVDVDAGKFLRLITGDRVDSMAGLSGVVSASTAARQVFCAFSVNAPAATALDTYLQWLTLTINER
jgi:hypothetical protein